MSDNIENFSQLLEESLLATEMRQGKLVEAVVVKVDKDFIVLSAGLKSEAHVNAEEFKGEDVHVGDEVEVVIDAVENGYGETRLSYVKAKRAKIWVVLENSYEQGDAVEGIITDRVKGGFIVDLNSVSAFLPGSLIDIKPIRDPSHLENTPLEFKVIKMDKRRNNIVVSRRAVMEAESSADREVRLAELQEGMEVNGIVKNVTDYGAFVDLGGIDGLLHITDMSWKRIKHPSEVINVGDELQVKILKFDREKQRVSLGMKQLGDDPWQDIAQRYPVNSRLPGVVSNVTDYGCFVELETGVEGLVHMSEMDWTNKNIHPSKVVSNGQEVEVLVLEVDQERRRISLGLKQCKKNPWQDFSENHKVGDKVKGNVRSITDFGVFIGLNGEIDGLVHLSDLSWDDAGEEVVRKFTKGDEVEAVILAIDSERERISLGIKQLGEDLFGGLLSEYSKDHIFTAKVKELAPREAILALTDTVNATLKVQDYSRDMVRDLGEVLAVEQNIDVRIVNIDHKSRTIYVSHKALEQMPADKSKLRSGEAPTNTTLGDLLKKQIEE
jgi:small subunit ribosomal protein S1